MIDTSVYIWKAGRDNHYKAPKDLIGAKPGDIRGYRYVGVAPLVKDNKIQRTDTGSECQLKRMILSAYDARITPLDKRNEDNYCTGDVTAAQLTIN